MHLALRLLALSSTLAIAACSNGAGPTGGGGGSGAGGQGPGAGGGGPGSGGSSGTGGGKPTTMSCDATSTATAPPSTWKNATSNLAGKTSECGNLTMVSADPCSESVLAGVARQGLWSTTDGGATWTQLGTSGDRILNRPTTILYDPADPKAFWEAGIYGWENPWSMGVFLTKNDGASFTGYSQLSMIQSHQDSISVDFGDPERKIQLAGGHEQKQVLFRSTDGGANFTDIGKALPAGTGFCTNALVVDAKTFLIGCAASWSQEAGGIARSTDGGATFTNVSPTMSVAGHPLWASDGSIYWTAEAGGMLKSTDRGATWTKLVDGTQANATPIELADGRLLSMTADHITLSKDQGKSWSPIGDPLPYAPAGFTYSAKSKTLFVWHNDCGNNVLTDAIMSAGWDDGG